MKRVLAAVLTGVLCLGLLAGCGSKADNGSTSGTAAPAANSGSEQQAAAPAGDSGSAQTEAAINFDEPPYEIVLENLTLGEEMADVAEVEAAVNAITQPAINCTFKFLNLHIADHVTKMSLMAAGGEKVDIVTAGRTYQYPNMVADGLLLPLDELLNTRGQGIIETVGDKYLDACRVSGTLYMIPGKFQFYDSTGIIYNADMAEKYGITVPEKPTAEDIEKLAAEVKAADPNMYLLSRGTGEMDTAYTLYMPNIQALTTNAAFGVIDTAAGDMKVLNLYELDGYREVLHKNHMWYENAWIPQDSMVSGVNVRDVFTNQQCFCEFGMASPMQMGILAPGYSFPIDFKTFRDPEVSTSSLTEHGWGISINCERPDKAMDFLNLMYTNGELSNVLTYGIEGKHYVKISDNIIGYPEGVNGGNVGYVRRFSDFGDQFKMYQFTPVTEEDIVESKKISVEAVDSPVLGYVFDTTELSTQVSNVTNVLAEYLPPLVVGIYDDAKIDEQLDKMIEALKAAGIDDIIAENQRQLDEWLASK